MFYVEVKIADPGGTLCDPGIGRYSWHRMCRSDGTVYQFTTHNEAWKAMRLCYANVGVARVVEAAEALP